MGDKTRGRQREAKCGVNTPCLPAFLANTKDRGGPEDSSPEPSEQCRFLSFVPRTAKGHISVV